jgi:transcription elongation factor Elf1
MSVHRFQDQQKRITDFQQNVVVHCPACSGKASATVDYTARKARLGCLHCGFNKECSTEEKMGRINASIEMAAHLYFDASLWYRSPFRNEIFFAFNKAHLDYLKQYIGARLREHKDRTHFTLLEKLPKFYHDARNREALLKLIEKLGKK